jgi:hypothetical protein
LDPDIAGKDHPAQNRHEPSPQGAKEANTKVTHKTAPTAFRWRPPSGHAPPPCCA